MVLIQVRVEQINGGAPDGQPPHADEHIATERLHLREKWLAMRTLDRPERRQRRIEAIVHVLLPAVEPDPLVEVTAAVEDSDADDRHAEIGRGLAVIAGQHTQATRINGHGMVNPELGAEIGDWPVAELGIFLREPGEVGRLLALVPLHHAVVQLEEARVGGALREPLRVERVQHAERIVPVPLPEMFVETAEEHPRVPVPAPGEIARDRREARDARRKKGKAWRHDLE